jgi:hypothetical protein
MATVYKVLGQINPSATTNTNLYTVPAATTAVTSTLVVCNQAATAGTYRLAVRIGGETIGTKNYLVYDGAIPANDSITLTMGMSLATTDIVTVYGSSANFSFTLFGSEF